jgi:hypothetical protein
MPDYVKKTKARLKAECKKYLKKLLECEKKEIIDSSLKIIFHQEIIFYLENDKNGLDSYLTLFKDVPDEEFTVSGLYRYYLSKLSDTIDLGKIDAIKEILYYYHDKYFGEESKAKTLLSLEGNYER